MANEPQRLQPLRMYEGGDEIDPANKRSAAVPEGGPKTVQDYYREVTGNVHHVDLSTGQEHDPDTTTDDDPPIEPPENKVPTAPPPKADIKMKVPAPTVPDDIAGAAQNQG